MLALGLDGLFGATVVFDDFVAVLPGDQVVISRIDEDGWDVDVSTVCYVDSREV